MENLKKTLILALLIFNFLFCYIQLANKEEVGTPAWEIIIHSKI
jgi:hypothetical protein